MMPRFDRIFGEPAELAHLGWRDRMGLMEESRIRNRHSRWGRLHQRLLAAWLVMQVVMLLLMFAAKALFESWLVTLLFAAVMLFPTALIVIDHRRVYTELQSLMLERGIRPAVCFRCRYDLKNSTSDACPECGEPLARESSTNQP